MLLIDVQCHEWSDSYVSITLRSRAMNYLAARCEVVSNTMARNEANFEELTR